VLQPPPINAMADSYGLSPLARSSRKLQRVTFNLDPHITLIKNISGKRHLPMASQFYQTLTAENVTDDMLAEAARLFNENYGVWGPQSHRPGEKIELPPPGTSLITPARQSRQAECAKTARTIPSPTDPPEREPLYPSDY